MAEQFLRGSGLDEFATLNSFSVDRGGGRS